MAGWNGGLSLVLMGLLVGGRMPGLAEPVRVAQAQAPASSEAQGLIDEGMKLFGQGSKESLQQALVKFAEAIRVSRAADDKPRLALALLASGRIFDDLGERPKALEFYNQALPIWRAVGDRSNEATTLSNIGLVYDALGERQKALEFYNQSFPIWRAVGDRSGEATTLNNIGLVYNALGEKQKALELYNQALPILRAVGNRSMEATTLNNIGLVYDALGEKQKALVLLNQALPISRAVGNRSMEATTLNNIGNVYDALGEKQKALEFYNQSLPLSRAVGDRTGEARTLNNIGLVYDALGEKQKALEFYNQALPIWRAVGDRTGEATTLNNIGLVYDALGEKQKALEFYNQALPIRRAVGDRSGEAVTLNNIGLVYDALGEKQKALEFYNQSLPLSRAVGDRTGEARTLNNIGLVYDALGEKQKALEFYNQSLPIWRAVGDRSGELTTFGNIALLYHSQNRLPEALTQINTAITLIEQLRSNLKDDQLKTSYFATVQGYYQFKINLLMQLHQQNPTKGYDAQALETSDQSRARVLRDLLTEARANITKNISPQLKQREDDLIQKLNAREKQLIELSGKPGTDKAIETLKNEIQQLLQAQQTLKAEIRQTNPAYANLQYPKLITLVEIQQQLDPETLLLQYQLGKDQGYLWVIGKTSLNSYVLPKQADLETAVQDFRVSLLSGDEDNLSKLAPALTQKLLGPAANQLGNKRLVIIPDGILHKLPFAILADPNAKTNDGALPSRMNSGSSLHYQSLLETHEISYLPSASTIAILRSTPHKPAPKTIALLADPVFGTNDDRLKSTPKTSPIPTSRSANLFDDIIQTRFRSATTAPKGSRDFGLARLPFTQTEANAILRLTPSPDKRTAFGFDATYDWVTHPDMSQYRYIHLATHGLFDSDRPELSSIALTAIDPQGNPLRSFLRLGDLFNLNWPADLIVLSACQTGIGTSKPGEGLIGMTRGLMYAGTQRVALTLWDVNDQATAELMSRFYQNLWKQSQSPAAALRSAQLDMLRSGSPPAHWSAFILQGEWRN